MFDIGFTELMMVGIIALIVLGPERLPQAARTVGLWIGKAKRSFNAVKTEIDRELKVQDLRAEIESQKEKLEKLVPLDDIKHELDDVQASIEAANKTASSQLNEPEIEQEASQPSSLPDASKND